MSKNKLPEPPPCITRNSRGVETEESKRKTKEWKERLLSL